VERSGGSAESRHLKNGEKKCGGLPTRRYGTIEFGEVAP